MCTFYYNLQNCLTPILKKTKFSRKETLVHIIIFIFIVKNPIFVRSHYTFVAASQQVLRPLIGLNMLHELRNTCVFSVKNFV